MQSSTLLRATPASALVFGESAWPETISRQMSPGTVAPAAPTAPPRPSIAPAPTVATPSRTAITANLAQADVDRLAAIRLRNAADIEAFFRRGGQAGFIDWYNAGLAHSAPFRARGAIDTRQAVRDRFTTFWNQVPTAFDRPEINALDFCAFTAICINEVRGNLWANPETSGRGGGGRSDSRGPHPGLAYFFDRVELRPGRFKRSYNQIGRTAGALFNDDEYIQAHGTLPGAERLARHGGDFGGAWNGSYYPQADFDYREIPANGFIMQADFYKFRGRGVIQTTGRGAYERVAQYIQGYTGSNTVLADFSRRWRGLAPASAATRSRTEDWDAIFGQGEMLAKGLSLHAGTRADRDYRRMSTDAAILHDVTQGGRPPGRTGSIYAMGRRISGSHDYGRGVYRDRVLALAHGMLTL